MDAWKYEIYFSGVEQDILLVRFALQDISISWSTLKIHFIFLHIHVLFFV